MKVEQILDNEPTKDLSLLPILFAAMGTLKHGGSNFRLLKDCKFLGTGSTDAVFGMKSLGGYPSLIVGDKSVKVAVFEIDYPTLKRLDNLEGYRSDKPLSSYFTREEITITLEDTSVISAWIYYVAHPKTIAGRPDVTNTDEYGRLVWE